MREEGIKAGLGGLACALLLQLSLPQLRVSLPQMPLPLPLLCMLL